MPQHMIPSRSKSALIASLTMFGAIGLTPADGIAAADLKVFPGAACQIEGSVNYGTAKPSVWSLWGGAYFNGDTNKASGYDHVICPITRDNTNNTNGTSSVRVRIFNSGSGRGFHCDLWSLDKFGGAGTVSGYPSFPNPLQSVTATAQATGLIDLSLNLSRSTAGGYYALHCEVPPDSYIYSYQVSEFADTNAN